jgi:hypothetical protein
MSLFLRQENKSKRNLKKAKENNLFVSEIEQEYSIKRCNFNPISPSPNKFIKNLEIRMKMYYKELYKSYK